MILLLLDVQLALLTFLIFPVVGLGSFALPGRLDGRVPAHARDDRRDHRLPAGDAVGHPRRAHVRPGAAPQGRVRRAQRGQPRREHDDGQPERRVLPRGRARERARDGGVLLYGGYQAIQGEVTIGVLVAFVAALNGFFDPIQQLSQVYTTYQSGMAALDKIFELLDVEPDLVDTPGRDRAAARARRARVPRRVVPLRRRRAATRSATSPCRSRPGRRSRSSARPARASRRSPSSSRASTTRPRAPCSSTGTTCATSRRRRCASSSASCRRRASSSAGRSARTSPSAGPTRRVDEVEDAARAVGADELISALSDGYETQVGERGVSLIAGQRQLIALRPRARRRPAAPHPRRGDVERRPAHRGPHRGRPAAAARQPHRDRHRPPPLDDPPGRAHRRPGARPDRRAGHPRGAARRRRAPTGACTATGTEQAS